MTSLTRLRSLSDRAVVSEVRMSARRQKSSGMHYTKNTDTLNNEFNHF